MLGHGDSTEVERELSLLTAQPEIVGGASLLGQTLRERNENRVMKLVKQRDANLSPAINRTWTDLNIVAPPIDPIELLKHPQAAFSTVLNAIF